MTTILKALEESERRGAPTAPGAPAWTGRGPSLPWIPIVAAVLILGGGALGLAAFSVSGHSSQSISGGSPAVGADPARPTLQAPKPARPQALPPPVVAPIAQGELPWAHVERNAPSTAAAPPAPAPAEPQAQAAGAGVAQTGAAVVAGEPDLQLQSLAYSKDPAGRTVTLRINGRTATLHEGESAGGIEVQLILRDAAYLRRGGSVFAVSPWH